MLFSRWLRQQANRQSQSRKPRSRRLTLEHLEDRLTPTTFTVTSTTDTNVAFAIVGGQLDLGGVGSGVSGDLRYCISQANETSGPNVIDFNVPANSTIALNQMLMIYNDVTIRGDTATNLTISGQGLYRVLYINNGTVNLDNLTIADGLAQGGDGGFGGGGGAGLGGGLLINSGLVTLSNVAFDQDQAIGGNGSDKANTGSGGGGGGLGGDGGNATGTDNGSGGGGGFLGSGGLGTSFGAGGGGGLTGDGGNGQRGAIMYGNGSTIGGGGGGGFNGSGLGSPDGGGNGGTGDEGGGGGGGSSGFVGSSPGQDAIGVAPGAGGFGGGGGGDQLNGALGGDYGGGGGGQESGGNGGFGGGGGWSTGGGASGGFGGGGSITGPGGAFGGSGASSVGGGGAGLGGAIFVRAGNLTLLGASFTDDSATGGLSGGGAAQGGQGKAGALFILTGATARSLGFAPSFSGNSAADAGSTASNPQDNADVYGTLTVDTNLTFSATSGTPQSTLVNTAFARPLRATLLDNGGPVSGVAIEFSGPASGAGATFPTGSVAVTDANGVAVLAVGANNTGGSYNVTASAGGTSAIFSLTNLSLQVATTTAVSSSLDPSVYGQAITFTATVTPTASSGFTPTGTVTFLDGATTLGTGTLSTTGGVTTATLTTSALFAGSHSQIVAEYAGDSNFNSSNSSNFIQTVSPAPLTITAATFSKTYDAGVSASATPAVSGLQGSDSVTGLAEAFSSKDVAGTDDSMLIVTAYTIDDANGGHNYAVTIQSATGTITPATLTVSATGFNKVYDTTAAATVVLSDNHLGSDSVIDSYGAASFSDKNVGTGKAVIVSGISIGGADASDYILQNTTASATASITPASLTVSAVGVDKVYDTTTAATVSLSDNHLGGDSITDSYTTASFSDKNAGSSKTVSVNGISISGAEAGNYSLQNSTASTAANITPAPLTVSASGMSKVYDATTAATVTLSDNHFAGDGLTDSYASAAFANKNVGTAKPITVSGIVLSGTDAGNYALQNSTATTTADITPATLTVSAVGMNKVYDGTTTATVIQSDNHLGSDSVIDNFLSASFSDKNAGGGKSVSVSGISISGVDAGNYTLQNTTASTTATITPAPLTITVTAANKVYDTTTAATVSLSDNHIASDSVTDSYTSASFSDKNAGNAKTVTVSGISISGADAGNYSLQNSTATTSANITPALLTVSASGMSKVYGATTIATVTLADNRFAGDSVTESYASAAFADKNVGAAKPITVSGIVLSGTDAANYALQNSTATTTADITPASLTVSVAGVNKVYDGTTTATVVLSDNHIGSDSVSDIYTSASFNNKNAGNGKPISVSGVSISGADAGNYTLQDTTASTTATITLAPLTVSVTAANKVYDTTTAATVSLSDNHIAGDSVTDSYTSASFSDKNAANGKTVSVSGISLSGADAGNYSLQNSTASATANITPAPLTVSVSGVSKVYDATTAATVSLSDNHFAGDTVTDSYASATFANKNVGAAKSITVSGISLSGTAAANYALQNTTASTSANITPRPLTVSTTAANKVYDGTTAATVLLADNHLSGDAVTDSYTTAAFSDKNAGTGKNVAVSGISISGADAGNYSLQNTTATTAANITPALLTVTANNATRLFGSANPSFTYTISGFVVGDASSVVSGSPSLTTSATSASAPGSYPILASQGSLNAVNYTFTFVNGTFTIAPAGILILNSAASGALNLSGNSVINETADVIVDSSSATAIQASGNASVTSAATEVVGGVQGSGQAAFHPAPVKGVAAVPDPFLSLAAPNGGLSQGAVNLSGNNSLTINPGVYSSISVSGNAKLTLNAGTYVIAGGGLSVTGNATVTGSGILIYNAGSNYPNAGGSFGSITLSGNATVTLAPATTATYAGIGIFQSRDNSKPFTLSGNAQFSLGSTGILYAPAAPVQLSGNSYLVGALIVNELALSGNADPGPELPERSAHFSEANAAVFVELASSVPLASGNGPFTSPLHVGIDAAIPQWTPAERLAIAEAFASLAASETSGGTDDWTELFNVAGDTSLALWEPFDLA